MATIRIVLLSTIFGVCLSICVLDNKKGWWLDCGIRDSYLLRIKDFGGAYVRFDFDVGWGDEKGFPYSIDNTNKDHSKKGGLHKGRPKKHPYIVPEADKHAVYGLVPPRVHHNRLYNRAMDAGGDPKVKRPRVPGIPFNKIRQGAGISKYNGRRKGGRRPAFMKVKTPDSFPPPDVIPAPDNKGVWVRVSEEPNGDIAIPPPFPSDRLEGSIPRPPTIRQAVPTSKGNPAGLQFDLTDGTKANIDRDFSEYDGLPEELRSQISTFRSPPPLQFTTPEPYTGPVIGRVLGEILKLPATTPADSDHVPSFAAQRLVVKDAPKSLHPPGYNDTSRGYSLVTTLPRTKFFCEEQEYLPGLYADMQLGCKIFHLCVPAPLGSTIQSFLCPNSTLFDQSILQCNYWQLVECSQSSQHFDANQPMAHSYRRVNAAHLPADHVKDPLTLSLLSDITTQ